MIHSGGRPIEGPSARVGRRRWWLLAPAVFLSLLSAYLFVRFIGAAAFYSDWGPITSVTTTNKAAELTYASHRAHVFFLRSVAVAALAALLMAPVIQLSGISSKGFRLLARYLLALALCLLTTGVLVWILGVLQIG